MATLKEFEEALKEQGMGLALAILDKLRERDRGKRSASPAPPEHYPPAPTPDISCLLRSGHSVRARGGLSQGPIAPSTRTLNSASLR